MTFDSKNDEAGASQLTAFHTLLVPLDGSALAEVTVPAAIAIARALDASVTLLHVLEHDAPGTVHGERHLRTETEAGAYLAEIGERVTAAGVPVEVHVHANPEHDVAKSLVAHTDELAGELVILAAHGGGGLRGFLFGRIALQVVRRGAKPVLLMQEFPQTGQETAFVCRKIAVLLNGTAEAEAALPSAVAFARGFGAALHLIFAVPTASTLPADRAASGVLVPSATRAILDLEQESAGDYLAKIAARLAGDGLSATSAVVRGEIASEAVAEAERVRADLLAFATHGRGWLGGLWSGSIGTKVASRFRKPLLLVPVGQAESGD
jgi:nucleotide-binding universal stress UspA family protein